MVTKRIYLDYASLTPIDPRVALEMKKYSGPEHANPSSWYKEGVEAKEALDEARKEVAGHIHAHPNEVVFTSGGTEANNLALIGVVESLHEKGVEYKDMHVIISAIEHSSVRECANRLTDKEVSLDVVSVDSHGIISLDELKKKIRPNTVVVSIMTVNNEVGTVQPIREAAKTIRHARKMNGKTLPFNFEEGMRYPLFHTDAAQAFIHSELNVEQLGVDLLTLDGTKVYGPRGIGALYIKRNTPIVPIVFGGGQENGLRSGTENLPGITGFAKALEISNVMRAKETKRIAQLRGRFIKGLSLINPKIVVHGSEGNCAPHIVNVSIPGTDNEFFIIQLDANGISCSTKSSCLRDEEESYVLKSMGADSSTSVRFSFGRKTKEQDITKALEIIGNILHSS